MHGSFGPKIAWVFLMFACVAACTTGRTFDIKSLPAGGGIIIDGRADDWRGAQFFLEEQQLLVGIKNDSRFLYVCLVNENRRTGMQMVRRGLTVWFDPKGGTGKGWGIKFPLGRVRSVEEDRSSFPMPDEFEEEEPERYEEDAFKEVEIIGPHSSIPQRMDVGRAKEMGLEVCATVESGLFTYELKVPLQAGGADGIVLGAGPGQKVGLGVEAGEFRMRRTGMGMPGGGMARPPMGGGMGRGGGMMGSRAGGFRRPERLKVWIIIGLASGGATTQPTAQFPVGFQQGRGSS